MASRMILLAEEDPAIAGFLADNLVADGYTVLVADDKPAALELLETRAPDLVLCDVNGDTLHLLDAIRQSDGLASKIAPDTPLIVLSAHADELTRVRYFDRGSDDVIEKPFSYPELRARIGALLRRACEHPASGRVRVGALTIDPASRRVQVGETPVELSNLELALLRALAAEPTRVFTKAELLRDVWSFRCPGRTRTLDSHACRLRAKLAAAGDRRWIENVWGVGYRLVGVAPTPTGGARHETRAAAAQSRIAPPDTAPAHDAAAAGAVAHAGRRGEWARAVRRLRGSAREGRRSGLRGVPADEGHHSGAPGAAVARRLRSPRLRRAAVLDASPRVRHGAVGVAPVP